MRNERNYIIDRLAYLANTLINTTDSESRQLLAMAAMSVARTHHRLVAPAEGSP